MAKKKKMSTSKVEESQPVYLTKRVIDRAIQKGKKEIIENALKTQGYLVVVKKGWVVKVNAEGEIIERVSKVKTTKSLKIELD